MWNNFLGFFTTGLKHNQRVMFIREFKSGAKNFTKKYFQIVEKTHGAFGTAKPLETVYVKFCQISMKFAR